MKKILSFLVILYAMASAQAELPHCTSVFEKVVFSDPEFNQWALKSLKLSELISNPDLTSRQQSDLRDQLYSLHSHMARQSAQLDPSPQHQPSWLERLLGEKKTPRPLLMLDSYYGEFHGSTTFLPGRGLRIRVPFMTELSREQTRIEMGENGVVFSATQRRVKGNLSGIFVVGMDGEFYIASHLNPYPQDFRHSSFFAGAPVMFAGTLMMNNKGEIQSLTSRSGHYRPTQQHFEWVQEYLTAKGFTLLPDCCSFSTH